MGKHDSLLQEAKKAVDKLHTDSSVDKETTLSSLEDLREHVETLIQSLELELEEEDRVPLSKQLYALPESKLLQKVRREFAWTGTCQLSDLCQVLGDPFDKRIREIIAERDQLREKLAVTQAELSAKNTTLRKQRDDLLYDYFDLAGDVASALGWRTDEKSFDKRIREIIAERDQLREKLAITRAALSKQVTEDMVACTSIRRCASNLQLRANAGTWVDCLPEEREKARNAIAELTRRLEAAEKGE